MRSFITIIIEPQGRRLKVRRGTTILQALNEAGVSLRSECGGKGACGKCRVLVKDRKSVTQLTGTEIKQLHPCEIDIGYRLACCTILNQDALITIPVESRLDLRKIQVAGLERPVQLNLLVRKVYLKLPKPTLSDIRSDLQRLFESLKKYFPNISKIDYNILKTLPDTIRSSNLDVTVTIWNDHKIIAVEPDDTSTRLWGLAIDIGTSKIVVYLIDLLTGKTVAIGSIENPQVMHGEDIMSRIAFAMGDAEKLGVLQKLAVEGINSVLQNIHIEENIDPNQVYEAVVVGNTAMHHFFLAIQPKYLAFSPFTPATKSFIDLEAKELNVKMNPCGIIHVLPVIAGFVGSDGVGNLLSSGIYESEQLSLLIDIGTNTEIFLGNVDDIICCSCASGPAFEGVHIKHGMKAGTGAIEKVSIDIHSYEVTYETIGHVKPVGLCGSAVVDVIAEMLKCGIINYRGRFNIDIETARLKKTDRGVELILVHGNDSGTGREIMFTQKDLSEIQLAKAAIFAGCSILMKNKNVEKKDLDQVLISGAFGNNLDPENAKFIGLLPDVPTEKMKFIGNGAIVGARMALISKELRETAEALSEKVRYLELVTDPNFNKEFAYAMFIPHRDLDRFPVVHADLRRIRKNAEI